MPLILTQRRFLLDYFAVFVNVKRIGLQSMGYLQTDKNIKISILFQYFWSANIAIIVNFNLMLTNII